MSKRTYEMASAYVAIMPSLEGMQGELTSQIEGAMPSLEKTVGRGLTDAFKGASGGAAQGLFQNLSGGINKIGDGILSTVGGAMSKAGGLFTSTITTGLKGAAGLIGGGVTAVVGKAAAGGFTRALGLNTADAKLSALGYSAEKVAGIMEAAGNAIDGTAYAMDESVGTATQLLSAGITDTEKLEQALRNVGKLSDISGTSFADMGTIFAKNAASGKVQYADLVQLMNHQIPIMSELSKSMNIPVEEVRAMASAGEISFQDFQNAVEKINFDSVIYATKDVGMAWRNVTSQLSKTGAIFWEPIVDGLGPVLNVARQALIDFRENPAVKDLTKGIITQLETGMGGVVKWAENLGNAIGSKSKMTETVEEWMKKFREFRESIVGLEGVLGGLGVAIGSSFLSKLPVIGGMFGGITLGVGALGGALVQVYKESSQLQTAFKTLGSVFSSTIGSFDLSSLLDTKALGDKMAEIVYAFTNFFNSIFNRGEGFDLQGFSLDGLLDAIGSGIKAFLDALSKHGEEIKSIVSGIAGVFSEVFESLASSDGDFIDGLVSNIIKALEMLPSLLSLVMEIGVGFLSTVTAIGSSDIAQSIFGVIGGILEWIAESNWGPLIGGAIAVFYSLNKLTPVMGMAGKAFSSILSSGVGGAAQKAGEAITGGIEGFFNGLKSIVGGASSTFTSVIEGVREIVKSIVELVTEIVKSLGPLIESVSGVIQTIFTEIGLIFETMVKAMGGVGKAVMAVVPELAALGVFILAIGALIWALDSMGVFDTLRQIALDMVEVFGAIAEAIGTVIRDIADTLAYSLDGILTVLETHWPLIEAYMELLGDFFLETMNLVLEAIVDIGQMIVDGITGLVEGIADGISEIIGSVGGLLESLAENGLEAGAGALAAAGGITALAGALVLLTGAQIMEGLASFALGALDGIAGFFGFGEGGGLESLVEGARVLKEFSEIVDQLPASWDSVGAEAFDAGSKIMNNFGEGLILGLSSAEQRVSSQLASMLSRLQSQVSSTPINLRVNGAGVGGSSSSYTTNNSYNISTRNSSIAESLIRASRGARRY